MLIPKRPLLGIVCRRLNNFRMASSVESRKLRQGEIIGMRGSLPDGGSFFGYRGIPYAKPPLGELRFMSPEPLQKFPENPFDCREERGEPLQKSAMDGSILGSEDCLFLNVYGPTEQPKKPLPVMVFIHGGAFLWGSGNCEFYGPLYLVQEGVVVVTINYRLGAFGFLSFPEANIPGNAGLKDQQLALKWVQENIEEFGGNPSNVTLFGESAGAASVHMHMYAESSRKFFHKTILQSGTSNMQWAVQRNPSYKARTMAKLLGCSATSDAEIAKFLRTTHNTDGILKNTISVLTKDERRRDLPMPFKPVVEPDWSPDAIVTKEPIDAMMERDKIDLPVMMGYNSAEGILMIPKVNFKAIDEDLGRLIPRGVNVDIDGPAGHEIANSVRELYFKGKRVDTHAMEELATLQGDFHFVIGAHAAAEVHSKFQPRSPLFFYRFGFDGRLNFYKKMTQLEHLQGACHADDLFYLFQVGLNENPLEKGSAEEKMVRRMCKLWTNFAKFGHPTPPEGNNEDVIDFVWNPVRKIAASDKFVIDYLDIDQKTNMKVSPDGDRMDFWGNIFNTFNRDFLKHKL